MVEESRHCHWLEECCRGSEQRPWPQEVALGAGHMIPAQHGEKVGPPLGTHSGPVEVVEAEASTRSGPLGVQEVAVNTHSVPVVLGVAEKVLYR